MFKEGADVIVVTKVKVYKIRDTSSQLCECLK
jgi:hypothetical protein